jgi:hypothetical protein
VRGLIDTSLLIDLADEPLSAIEQSESLELAISVVSLAELQVGVLTAPNPTVATARMRALAEAERLHQALPVDRAVAYEFAALMTEARANGRRPKSLDALIGATARAHRIAVYTRDTDFAAMPGVDVVRV